MSRRRPRGRRRRPPSKRRLPPLILTARQPQASTPRQWGRPSGLMVRPPLRPRRRPAPRRSRRRRRGHVRCRLPPRLDNPEPANRRQTSCQPPAEPAHRPHRRRPQARRRSRRRRAPVISVVRRPAHGHGPVRPVDCQAVRDRLGVAPGFRAPGITRSRLLRAWASRARLGPGLQSRPPLVGRAHRWAALPCRGDGQACPACRGRIRP